MNFQNKYTVFADVLTNNTRNIGLFMIVLTIYKFSKIPISFLLLVLNVLNITKNKVQGVQSSDKIS